MDIAELDVAVQRPYEEKTPIGSIPKYTAMKYYLTTLLLSFMISFGELEGQISNVNLSMELEEFILNEMEQHNIPGFAGSIIVDGEIVWSGTYGMANISTNTPVNENTKFTVASISKLFTAWACVLLWEAGSLDIDADINTYLPFEIINPNFPDVPITTRQLLLHKSSLKDSESDLELWDNLGDPDIPLGEFCEGYFVEGGDLYSASNWNTSSPTNSSYWYSNAGFTLLGYIVEQVSNQAFNEYCAEHVFSIFEMPTSGWFYSEVDSSNVAMPYSIFMTPYGYYSVPEYPAAMLKADILELSNFLIAITQRGNFNGNQLMEMAKFETMLPDNMENGFGWWGKDTWYGDPTGNYWSHGGFMNGVRSQLNYYPTDSAGLIILTNGEGFYQDIQNKMEEFMHEFQTENATSIQKANDTNSAILVYPNPAIDIISIRLSISNSKHCQFIIYNMLGDQVLSGEMFDEAKLDISGLSEGEYFVRVLEGNDLVGKFFFSVVR